MMEGTRTGEDVEEKDGGGGETRDQGQRLFAVLVGWVPRQSLPICSGLLPANFGTSGSGLFSVWLAGQLVGQRQPRVTCSCSKLGSSP